MPHRNGRVFKQARPLHAAGLNRNLRFAALGLKFKVGVEPTHARAAHGVLGGGIGVVLRQKLQAAHTPAGAQAGKHISSCPTRTRSRPLRLQLLHLPLGLQRGQLLLHLLGQRQTQRHTGHGLQVELIGLNLPLLRSLDMAQAHIAAGPVQAIGQGPLQVLRPPFLLVGLPKRAPAAAEVVHL